MRAPICRTCGIAHWGSDHVYPRTKAPSQADLSVGLPDRPSLAPRKPPSSEDDLVRLAPDAAANVTRYYAAGGRELPPAEVKPDLSNVHSVEIQQPSNMQKVQIAPPPTGAMASDVELPKFLRRKRKHSDPGGKLPVTNGADLPGRLTASKPMMGPDLSDAALRPGVQTDAGDRATQPTASLFTEEDAAAITEASASDTVGDEPTDVLTSTGKTDRKKYLREYMRQYRADVKAAKAKAATEGMA